MTTECAELADDVMRDCLTLAAGYFSGVERMCDEVQDSGNSAGRDGADTPLIRLVI